MPLDYSLQGPSSPAVNNILTLVSEYAMNISANKYAYCVFVQLLS